MEKRKIGAIILILMLGPIICNFVDSYAMERKTENGTEYVEIIPKWIKDAEIERQIEEGLKRRGMIQPLDDRNYIYENETVAVKYITLSGYVGNQPPGGTRFATGGAFYWVPDGGPTATGTVTFSVPYKMLEVTIQLGAIGKAQGVGLEVLVPDTKYYYKAYNSEEHEVRQVNTYRINKTTGERILWATQYPKTLSSRLVTAKRV